eukprot:123272_1
MDNILTEGYLCKKSQFLGSQRRRWTVLKGKYLTTYKQKQIYQNPTETFDLSVYDKLEYKDKNDVKFKLLSTRKNIKERIFMAESFDDMKQWVKSMQIMQQSLKQNKHHKINNKLNTKQSKQEDNNNKQHTPPINTRHMNQTNIVINNNTRNDLPFQNSKNVVDLNDNDERNDDENYDKKGDKIDEKTDTNDTSTQLNHKLTKCQIELLCIGFIRRMTELYLENIPKEIITTSILYFNNEQKDNSKEEMKWIP